jgi:predicted helicase
MNIEHEYYELTGRYEPFEDICLVDTFELSESKNETLSLFTVGNTQRVNRQKNTPVFVIISNPPYNARQINENDNNKNRKYPAVQNRIKLTYSADSKATNKNALQDMYVKALRWASDRLGTNEEGVVALVTNNSFIDDITFDGVRKHLQKDFSKIYHVNLKGDARTSGELRKREAGNIFDDQIRVGIGISFFLKKKPKKSETEIYIYSIDDYLKSKEKLEFIRESKEYKNINFKRITPDKNYTWLTEGLIQDFDTFLPMGMKGTKVGKSSYTIFKIYGRGVATCRDSWAYNFSKSKLVENINNTVDVYNSHVLSWNNTPQKPKVDDFVAYDETKISWSRDLKLDLQRGKLAEFEYSKIRKAFY